MATHAGPRYRTRPWRARLSLDGRVHELGLYATRAEAEAAEDTKAAELGLERSMPSWGPIQCGRGKARRPGA